MKDRFLITEVNPVAFQLTEENPKSFQISEVAPFSFHLTEITPVPVIVSAILTDAHTLVLTYDQILKETPTPALGSYIFTYSGQRDYNDWFLPSIDELKEMHDELYAYGVGGFNSTGVNYWSSTESGANSVKKVLFLFGGIIGDANKQLGPGVFDYIRACRSFTAGVGDYALRDVGPAGGLIFYISGTTYYEAAPSDQGSTNQWSNITTVEIGITAQGTAIGTGQANTTAIINQAGHTSSAAKLCNDLSIVKDISVNATLVSISDYAITVTLDENIQSGETLSVQYVPGANPVQDPAGNLADAFTMSVDTSLLVAAPVVTSVEVGTIDNYTWRLVFDKALYSTLPSASSFAVTGFTFASITLAGTDEIRLVSNEAGVNGAVYNMVYTQPVLNPLQGLDDNYVVSFTESVTNNVPVSTVRIDSTLVKIDSTLITIDNGI